jgi:DNA-binding MarR family transcriptional regulator
MSQPLRHTRAGPDSVVDDPQREIGRLIKLVFASLVRGIDQRMQPVELTAMQWEPLLLLWLKRADTVAALARESRMDCGAMTRMLDRLEEKQLLTRHRSETDRRVVHLQLTEKGRKVSEAIVPLVKEELAKHLRGFRKDELVTLRKLLNRMLINGQRDE